jgi:hypothetical protein
MVMKISRNTKKAYAYTLMVFTFGLYSSIYAEDWSWFSRSGSIVVIIGIILTSSQIFEHNRRLRQNRVNWETHMRRKLTARATNNSQFARDWASDDGLRALFKARQEEETIWEIEGHGLYMLILGTLVWGFGDLLELLPFL